MVIAPKPLTAQPSGVRRLRNAAILALARNDSLTPTVLVGLRADCAVARADQPGLHLVIRREDGHLVVYLDDDQARALRLYLEAARLWAEPRNLFGLGLEGVKKVLQRARRGR